MMLTSVCVAALLVATQGQTDDDQCACYGDDYTYFDTGNGCGGQCGECLSAHCEPSGSWCGCSDDYPNVPDDFTGRGDYYICDTTSFSVNVCAESCASPTADACAGRYTAYRYCDETSGLCAEDPCDSDSDCGVRDGYELQCQYGYCEVPCSNFNDTYCSTTFGENLRCQTDGTCGYSYCYDGEECPDGMTCNNQYCVNSCTSDDECADQGNGYTCADGLCAYYECYSNDDCDGEGYVCNQEDLTNYFCFEGCASPNGIYGWNQTCNQYYGAGPGDFVSCNAETGQCETFNCNTTTDCDGVSDTVDLVCQWGSCIESCIGQDDEDYCALIGNGDSVCQDSGLCDYSTCYNGEECPDDTVCTGYYCEAACADDAECIDRYYSDDYKCDAGVCVYNAYECSVDDDCGDGQICMVDAGYYYCSESCQTTGCDWGDDYDCTDACQDDGICGECTYLGCNAPSNSCDDYGFQTECQDDGECGYPSEDECAEDADCDGDQICQYLPNFDAPADAAERRFCGDSCVGQDAVNEYNQTYCSETYGYENCDTSTGTCYNCRSDDDCTSADRPTCYLGTGFNGCYRACVEDSDCDGDDSCLFEEDAQVYYCGQEETQGPIAATTASPTVEPTEPIVDRSGAVQQRWLMAAVAMASLTWWM